MIGIEMFSEVIVFLKEEPGIDEYGDLTTVTTERKVFARKDRVYLSQKIEASSKGQEVQLRFTLSDYLDYQGEKELLYKGKKYQIMTGDTKSRELEILCYGGTDNAKT